MWMRVALTAELVGASAHDVSLNAWDSQTSTDQAFSTWFHVSHEALPLFVAQRLIQATSRHMHGGDAFKSLLDNSSSHIMGRRNGADLDSTFCGS